MIQSKYTPDYGSQNLFSTALSIFLLSNIE